jgi:hypothetical protein
VMANNAEYKLTRKKKGIWLGIGSGGREGHSHNKHKTIQGTSKGSPPVMSHEVRSYIMVTWWLTNSWPLCAPH